MTDTPDRDERHLARMLRKKAVIDERIANSPNECGLLLVLTGNGMQAVTSSDISVRPAGAVPAGH